MRKCLFPLIILPHLYAICIGDLDQDNSVSMQDVSLLVADIMDGGVVNEVSDVNFDQITNIYDLLILIDFISDESNPCEIIWGETTSSLPEYYFSSDINSSQIHQIKEFHSIAKQEWGSFGPLEFWVVGTSLLDARELDQSYCELRIEKDPCLGNNYLQWCLNRDYNFEDYANYGGAGLSLNRGNPDDFCTEYSYMEITLSSQYPFPNESDYNVVTMHEYFHAYQHAHIHTYDYEERAELMVVNPWWSEGGAEYMAQLLYSQQEGVIDNYLSERMSWKMQSKNDLLEGELISDIPYGERAYIAYDLGTWAIAYLINIAGLDSYREDFYNDLNQYGWEGSFSINFGLSLNEFLVSFHEFLDLDINEQLIILP